MPIIIKRKGREVAISQLEEMQPDDVVPFELSNTQQQGAQDGVRNLLFLEFLQGHSREPRIFLMPPQKDNNKPHLLIYAGGHLYIGEKGLASTDGNREDGLPRPYSDSPCLMMNHYVASSALRQAGLIAPKEVK
jgi:hypothetical protein